MHMSHVHAHVHEHVHEHVRVHVHVRRIREGVRDSPGATQG